MKEKTRYDNLINDVNEIINKTDKLEIIHNNIKPIKDQITDGLSKHRDAFVESAKEAKELAEVNKYTIAFFGETNAGKSTIIETLRILGNEKTKIEEYAKIKNIQSDINSFQTEALELQQIIGNAKEKLIQQENFNKKLNANKEDYLKQHNKLIHEKTKEQQVLSRLEESLMEITERCRSIEKDQFIAKQQDEKLKKEIECEKEHLQQKLKSLNFRILRWIKNIFNKQLIINETRLEGLKVKEFEYTQALNELNTFLFEQIKNREDLKIKVDAEFKLVNKLEEHIKSLSIDIESIENEIKLLSETKNNLQATINDNSELINKIEICVTELTAKLQDLGDGKIIGTGVQDFTKNVNYYELNYNNQPIVLIDVPGIEGNEDRFTEMIKKALIKAHAIFYINGSNKKPEEKTLEKIKYFLRDQTEVYSISNVRGKADTYEFEEDREKLSNTHKDLEKTAELTKEVLSKVLQDKYKGHLNLQGFLAFISCTKFINPLRKDFIKSHKSILNLFENKEQIRAFSNFHSIEQLIIEQQPFTGVKIQIANLQTLIGVSSRFAYDISKYQEQTLSYDLIEQVEREFNIYFHEVENNKKGLNKSLDDIGAGTAKEIKSRLRDFLYSIIDKKYEEAYDLFLIKNQATLSLYDNFINNKKNKQALEEFVNSYMEQVLNHYKQKLNIDWNNKINDFFDCLQKKKKLISSRLEKVSSPNSVECLNINKLDFSVLTKGVDFNNILKKGWSAISTIGGMTSAGLAFGPIGTILAAILGTILSVIKTFFGGEKNEAKLQRELEPKLNEIYFDIYSNFKSAQEILLNKVETHTQEEHCVLENSLNDLKQLKSILMEKTIHVKKLIEEYKIDQKQLQHNIKEPILN